MKTSYNHCKKGASFCIRMTLLRTIQLKASPWFSSISCKHILKKLCTGSKKKTVWKIAFSWLVSIIVTIIHFLNFFHLLVRNKRQIVFLNTGRRGTIHNTKSVNTVRAWCCNLLVLLKSLGLTFLPKTHKKKYSAGL